MNLQQITLRLRPRPAYEATDLGIRLVQRNAGAVFRAWLVICVPIMLVCMTTLTIKPWLAALLIWWLKPLYDRVVLFVLSRSVFGQSVRVVDVLNGWRQWAGSGLFGALTWRRLELTRAFSLPVYMLEGQTGKARRARHRVLQKNTRNHAVLTQAAYLHVDGGIYLGAVALFSMLLPQYLNWPVMSWFMGQETPMAWTIFNNFLYIAAITLVEPLYVAAGFSLYLNRRVELEAWDIEIALRAALEKNGEVQYPRAFSGKNAPSSASIGDSVPAGGSA